MGRVTAIWAHRGACAYAPENTVPAFEVAVQMKADGVEIDVQRSADGHIVVIHDETINRTPNGVRYCQILWMSLLRQPAGWLGRRGLVRRVCRL